MKYLDFLHLYFDDTGTDGGTGDAGTTGTDSGTDGGASGDDRNTPKYSDAELDAIINKKLAKWKKQQEKAVDEATKLANMTAQERAEHERDTLQAELDKLKAEKTRAEMINTARGILQADGVAVSDAIVETLIGEDAEATSTRVKDFIKSYKADVQNAVKSSLSHKAPQTGDGDGTISREDIRKERNTHKRLEMYRAQMGINRK